MYSSSRNRIQSYRIGLLAAVAVALCALAIAIAGATGAANSASAANGATGAEGGSNNGAGTAAPKYAPDRLIVRFRSSADGADRRAARDSVDAELDETLPLPGMQLLVLPDGSDVLQIAKQLERNSAVRYAEPDYIRQVAATPVDTFFDQMWGLENTGQTIDGATTGQMLRTNSGYVQTLNGTPDVDIDAATAWDFTTGNSGVTVAIIDTGVDYDHPDLADNIWNNSGEVGTDGGGNDKRFNNVDDDLNGYVDDWHGYDFADDDSDPTPDNPHGTHTAGTVGARGNNGIGVTGVNWNSKVMPIDAFTPVGAYVSDLIEAYNYVAETRPQVVNGSYGGSAYAQAEADAIAAASNTLFVFAAGNDAENNDAIPHYPCNYDVPNSVCVAATNEHDQLASFSDYGASTVDLAAPGVNILSTVPVSDTDYPNDYAFFNGTSMATPHVAGAAGLLFAADPGATPAEVRNYLLSSVDQVPALAGNTTTGGRLNLAAAVEQATPPPTGQADVSIVGSSLVVRAGNGQTNSITAIDNGTTYTVTDPSTTLAPVSPCTTVNANEVSCPATGVTGMRIRSEDLNDTVTVIGDTPATIFGGSGDDNLNGGDGNDTVNPGSGNDVLGGGLGTDTADYSSRDVPLSLSLNGAADDGASGENGQILSDIESVRGGAQDDTIVGDAGPNTLDGSSGNDTIDALGGADTAIGNSGGDTIDGGTGTDSLDGGTGSDVLSYASRAASVWVSFDNVANDGEPGENDTIQNFQDIRGGSAGDSLVGNNYANVLDGGPGADNLDAGAGTDAVSYADRTQPVTVDLTDPGTDGEVGEGDTIAGIENLIGGAGNDTLVGDANNNVLDGRAGADLMDGKAGTDTVSYATRVASVNVDYDGIADDGEPGENDNMLAIEVVFGGLGADTMVGDTANNTFYGGANADSLSGGDGNDTLYGEGGDDALAGDGGTDTLVGGLDADTLTGGGGSDTANYADHETGVVLSLDGVANDGSIGESDQIDGDVENLTGGPSHDTLTGDNNANVLHGGYGFDELNGLDGNDSLYGDENVPGQNVYFGLYLYDVADGGAGSDLIEAETADYSDRTNNVYVNLGVSGNDDGEAGEGDNLVNIAFLLTGSGDDVVTGSASADYFETGAGNDTIQGGAGGDMFLPGPGADTVLGSTFADWFGSGFGVDGDAVYYSGRTADVSVTPDLSANDGEAGEGDNVYPDVIGFSGGDGDDYFMGTSRRNSAYGGAGEDELHGAGGNDYLGGGDGDDDLYGGSGSGDEVDGGEGADLLDGGSGSGDLVSYWLNLNDLTIDIDDVADDGASGEGDNVRTSVETVYGGDGDDSITGSDGDDELWGDLGDDTLDGAGGDDVLHGDSPYFTRQEPAATDVHIGGPGFDVASWAWRGDPVHLSLDGVDNDGNPGLNENDSIASDIEGIEGSYSGGMYAGDPNPGDVLIGNNADNYIHGAYGPDDIQGLGGDDVVNGGGQSDTVSGGSGNDSHSYEMDSLMHERTAPVIADLEGDADDGSPQWNEVDQLSSDIENLTGAERDDVLTGNNQANIIAGGAGDDSISGAGGNDVLDGGADNDTVAGDDGDDYLATLDDVIDYVSCGDGSDSTSNDSLDQVNADCEQADASTSRVSVIGSTLYYEAQPGENNQVNAASSSGSIVITESNAGATLSAGNSCSVTGVREVTCTGTGVTEIEIDGNDLDDTLHNATSIKSVINGGAGDDILSSADGDDSMVGGDGFDTADYSARTASVEVDIDGKGGDGETNESDNVDTTVERVDGGDGNDTIVGSSGDNVLFGGPGNDTIDGSNGDDTLDGGTGADDLSGDFGTDLADYSTRSAAVSISLDNQADDGELGENDNVRSDVENVNGGSGPDVIDGSSVSNTIQGFGGNDQITGGAAADTLSGGAGNDELNTRDGVLDIANCGADNDLSLADPYDQVGADCEQVDQIGSVSIAGNTLTVVQAAGWSDAFTVSRVGSTYAVDNPTGEFVAGGGCTGSGLHSVTCADSANNVTAIDAQLGDGADSLAVLASVPASVDATVDGGSGDDSIATGNGDDTLTGGADTDNLDGGAGVDTASYADHTGAVTVDPDGVADDGVVGENDNVQSNIENLTGGSGADALTGDGSSNVLTGGPGADTLNGLGGVDTASYADHSGAVTADIDDVADDGEAGEGDNVHSDIENLLGGSGNDTFVGTAAANNFAGGGGSDTVSYADRATPVTADLEGDADDGVSGENDTISTDVENLTGGSANDTLTGNASDNTLTGGLGTDTLVGGAGSDTASYVGHVAVVTADLDGVADDGATGENDSIATDVENLTGGSANDTLTGNSSVNVLDGGPGADVLNGLTGTDTVSYANRSEDITADLDGVADDGAAGEGDTVKTDIEHLLGGSGNDTLTGNYASNKLHGGAGNDTLDFGNGGSLEDISGGPGVDTAVFSQRTAGMVVSFDPSVAGQYQSGIGYTQPDIENVTGSGNADTITMNDSNNIVNGGNGDDTILPGFGTDTVSGGSGKDMVSYSRHSAAINVTLDGVANDGATGENDFLQSDVESVNGGAGDDTIIGNSADNTLIGGEGEDYVDAGSGNDFVDGDGENPLLAGSGWQIQAIADDVLIGGPGTDTVGYENRTWAVTVTLDGIVNDGDQGDVPSFWDTPDLDDIGSEFESIVGGAGADELIGNGLNNTIEGRSDDDTIVGGDGDDVLEGESSQDDIDGGAGNDTIRGGVNDTFTHDGGDEMSGGTGTDTAVYDDHNVSNRTASLTLDGLANDGWSGENDNIGSDIENVTGGNGLDTIVGDGGSNVLTGSGANDTITGGGGSDTLNGDSGLDTLYAREGAADTVNCGSSSDTVQADRSAVDTVNADCESVTRGPTVTITGGPAQGSLMGDNTPDLSFSSSEAGTFTCRYDANAMAACTSPNTASPPLTDGSRTFEVIAYDVFGNPSASATRTFTVDATSPGIAITSPANGSATSDTTPQIDFTLTEANPSASSTCTIDDGQPGEQEFSCTSGTSVPVALALSTHTVTVSHTDQAGNANSATNSFTVGVPPNTIIDSGPANGSTTDETVVNFEYHGSPSGNTASFECRMDAGAWAACGTGATGSYTSSALTNGSHTFEVRAKDASGNPDASPASSTFTVSVAVPGQLTKTGPSTISSPVNLTSIGTSDWIHWAKDAVGDVNRKASGGSQISTYTQVGSAATVSRTTASASYTWSDGSPNASASTTGGLIVGGASGRGFQFTAPASTTTRTLTFYVGVSGGSAFSSAKGLLTATLSDGSAATVTDSTLSSTSSADRVFTLTYRAASAGQTLTVKWTQNSSGSGHRVRLFGAALATSSGSAPQAPTITSPATDATGIGTSTAQLSFTGAAGASFQCKVDTASYAACTSPYTTAVLSDGLHTFKVRAIDAAGLVGPPATRTFFTTNQRKLTVSSASSIASPVNLTTEGTTDWSHWGQNSSSSGNYRNRKSGATDIIGAYASTTGTVTRRTSGPNSSTPTFTWTGGTPTASATANDDHVTKSGVNSFFRLNVPTSTTNLRTIKIYLGVYQADGTLSVYLSNSSTPDFVAPVVSNASGTTYVSYTIAYKAGSSADALKLEWKETADRGSDRISLHAVTAVQNADATAPETTIDSGPADNSVISSTTPTFTFSSEPGAQLQCRVDSGSFASCASPYTTTALSAGKHSYEVRAIDAAGNYDLTPARRVFWVDP